MSGFEYKIKEELGVHARPAGLLVQAAKNHPQSHIQILKGNHTADVTKLFAVMSLCIKCGDTIKVTADGEDADSALAEMREICTKYL
ncbi:HPr family phosphocarrier protein [Caproiciproducens sp. CPB-2]|uniref:HPr family phosphocarrier protein n=1 Tax=Caproiciproducens sp. CPB-2 TaxID=3030017 RepID=UPI0023DB545A|nr:HPr family phosphocarrier protein [Caproiciproducens sp. CPB-2]MDF1493167.1 HPr family phosphocarrier protein [Caproiciproducens sp. CPB-2]